MCLLFSPIIQPLRSSVWHFSFNMETRTRTISPPVSGAVCHWARRLPLVAAPLLLVALLAASSHADVSGTVTAAKPAALTARTSAARPVPAAIEQAVFQQINGVRKERGLEPVSLSEDLQAPAREHSRYMAGRDQLTHRDATGRGAGQRLDGSGIRWLRYGENVGLVKGYVNPTKTVVEAWLRSPGHAANILNPSLTESAVGVVVAADGTYYLTQVFVTR